jgi:hypothetical protein
VSSYCGKCSPTKESEKTFEDTHTHTHTHLERVEGHCQATLERHPCGTHAHQTCMYKHICTHTKMHARTHTHPRHPGGTQFDVTGRDIQGQTSTSTNTRNKHTYKGIHTITRTHVRRYIRIMPEAGAGTPVAVEKHCCTPVTHTHTCVCVSVHVSVYICRWRSTVALLFHTHTHTHSLTHTLTHTQTHMHVCV